MGTFFEALLWPLAVAPVSITWRLGSSPRCPSHFSPAPATADGVEACLSSLKCQSAPSHRPAVIRRVAMGKVFRGRYRRKKLISGGRIGAVCGEARRGKWTARLSNRHEEFHSHHWRLQGKGEQKCVTFAQWFLYWLKLHMQPINTWIQVSTLQVICFSVWKERAVRAAFLKNFALWPFNTCCCSVLLVFLKY